MNHKSAKEIEEDLLKAMKVFRNCRKIENRINQLQKQLYMGQKTAYTMFMKIIYPNYEEYLKSIREEKDGREKSVPEPGSGA